MKISKIVFLVTFTTSIVSAQTGEELFNKNCSSCHANILGITNNGGYDNSYITPAPYVTDLINKLKQETKTKENFVDFIKEYIQNPDKRKTLYGKKAIKKFGLMPSLKGMMNDEDIVKLTDFLYAYNDEKITVEKPKEVVKKITQEEELFNKNCSSCHAQILGIVNNGGYDNSYITPAPYVTDLISKLKKETKTKEKFVEFIKEYIQNPDKRKTLYGKKAIKKFGLMPSLKGAMKEEEIIGLANFLYQNY